MTFAHFEALIAEARAAEALDRVEAEVRAYSRTNPGDPIAGEVGEELARARRALEAARRPRAR